MRHRPLESPRPDRHAELIEKLHAGKQAALRISAHRVRQLVAPDNSIGKEVWRARVRIFLLIFKFEPVEACSVDQACEKIHNSNLMLPYNRIGMGLWDFTYLVGLTPFWI